MADVMIAITIKQPWASAIAYGHKTIENRTWRPALSRLPMRIAIHAGMSVDPGGLEFLDKHGIKLPDLPTGAIVAVATLFDVVEASVDLWWSGPYGWRLREVVRVEPVACSGARGLWVPPRSVLRRLPP